MSRYISPHHAWSPIQSPPSVSYARQTYPSESVPPYLTLQCSLKAVNALAFIPYALYGTSDILTSSRSHVAADLRKCSVTALADQSCDIL